MSFDIHDLRRRVLAGDEISREEMRAAVEHLAPYRAGAIEAADIASTKASTSAKKKAIEKAPVIGLDDLL